MTHEKLIREMDEKLQFPGLTNTWTMRVQNRLDMALTGIKTPVRMKLQGTSPEQMQQLGAQVQQILSGLPQVRSVFREEDGKVTDGGEQTARFAKLASELFALFSLVLHSCQRSPQVLTHFADFGQQSLECLRI